MSPWIWDQPALHAAVLAVALGLDRLWGEVPPRLHPVVVMGCMVRAVRTAAPRAGVLSQLSYGLGMAIGIPALFAGLAWGLVQLPGIGPLAAVYLTTSSLAIRALGEGGERVGAPLRAGDLAGARLGLSWLCSRDAADLDEAELAGAAVESLAENASDSAVAPLLWFLVAGVPGIVAYRAVNTLDAMVGYRGELEHLGKASARLDDLLNLVPARLTAALLVSGGGPSWREGLRTAWRDASRTESPNAGWPMAAMAGLLGIQLTKRGHYVLGRPDRPIEAAHIAEAWCLAERAMSTAGLAAVAAMCLAAAWTGGRP